MPDLLLIVDAPDGRRRRVPIGSVLRIGGSGPGVLALGCDQPAARVDVRDDATWLVPLGGADVRVNDIPIDRSTKLALDDTIQIGARVARIALAPRLDIVDQPARISATIEAAKTPSAHDLREALRALPPLERNLSVLRELGDLLATVHDEDELLDRILELIFAVLPADRAAVIVRSGPDDTPRPVAVRFRKEKHEREGLPISKSILDLVLDGESSVLCEDASVDERFKQGASVILGGIRSAVAAPVRSRSGAIGALYLDSKLATGAFDENDLETVTTMGLVTGIALDNVRLHHESVASGNLAAVGKTVAGLAHDIRNVMSGLRTGVFLLDDELSAHPEKPTREAWELLKRTQETIGNLVDDMVSFSKTRAPEFALADLAPVVAAAAQLCEQRAAQRKVDVEVESTPVPRFEFDRFGVERCVLNLVGNAIDAVEAGGKVRVEVGRENDRALIAVTDDGPGIAVEDRERIFDLLFSTKGARGTGFGLAITRGIAEQHGGTVELESTLGKGSTFRLNLPLRNAES